MLCERSLRSWLDGFVDIRNKLAHSAVVKPHTIKQKFEDVLGRADASRLLHVLPAKEELAERLRGIG